MAVKRFAGLSQREVFARDQGDLPPIFRLLFASLPASVVQPETAEEAVAEVRAAYARGTPITVRGAGSTAFGQVLPVLGGLVLDVSFLKRVLAFEPDLGTVTVEAGARWSDLSAFLAERGWALRSYPSSWYSTVGGWVQTGGCGVLTRAFGPLRRQVARLAVCVEGGRTLELLPGSPDFDAFFETEGQLGLVLAVTLAIRPMPQGEYPLLVECPDLASACELYRSAIEESGLSILHAALYNDVRMRRFNMVHARRMKEKGSALADKALFAGAASVLLFAETREGFASLRDWLLSRGFPQTRPHQAAWLWNERLYPLKGKRADERMLGNELVLPDKNIGAYAATVGRLAEEQGLELAVEINAAAPGESVVISSFPVEFARQSSFLKRLGVVSRLDHLGTQACGGRIYHVGVYNTPIVRKKFPKERLAALRETKRRLDPKGLFNPGKFFSLKTRFTRWLPEGWLDSCLRATLSLLERPWLAALLSRLAGLLPSPSEPPLKDDLVLKTARECVNCGFCIPVCPAYLATRDERTTARGKLLIGARFMAGEALGAEETLLLHSCMHCGACTAVCQNTLDLVPVWRELERRAAEKAGGKPAAEIEAFVRDVESSEDYKRLLRRGYIVERQAAAVPAGSGA